MSEKHLDPEALEAWVAELAALYEVDVDVIDIDAIVNLGTYVSAQIAPDAAVLTAFVAGLAAGQEGGSDDAVADALESAIEQAEAWEDE